MGACVIKGSKSVIAGLELGLKYGFLKFGACRSSQYGTFGGTPRLHLHFVSLRLLRTACVSVKCYIACLMCCFSAFHAFYSPTMLKNITQPTLQHRPQTQPCRYPTRLPHILIPQLMSFSLSPLIFSTVHNIITGMVISQRSLFSTTKRYGPYAKSKKEN